MWRVERSTLSGVTCNRRREETTGVDEDLYGERTDKTTLPVQTLPRRVTGRTLGGQFRTQIPFGGEAHSFTEEIRRPVNGTVGDFSRSTAPA